MARYPQLGRGILQRVKAYMQYKQEHNYYLAVKFSHPREISRSLAPGVRHAGPPRHGHAILGEGCVPVAGRKRPGPARGRRKSRVAGLAGPDGCVHGACPRAGEGGGARWFSGCGLHRHGRFESGSRGDFAYGNDDAVQALKIFWTAPIQRQSWRSRGSWISESHCSFLPVSPANESRRKRCYFISWKD